MRVSRKSQGLDESEWIKCVQESYNERNMLFPLEAKQLKRLYEQDYSIEEAMLKGLTNGQIYALMELCIKHELGEYRTIFRTDHEAKEFFRKFPEIRKELTM